MRIVHFSLVSKDTVYTILDRMQIKQFKCNIYENYQKKWRAFKRRSTYVSNINQTLNRYFFLIINLDLKQPENSLFNSAEEV